MTKAYLAVAILLLPPLTGCASFDSVKPWQKGVLAKPAMSFEDSRESAGYGEHIYTSREAAAGGASVGGGGCGCN
ncbi:MAG: DUF4266 domain-containing protein [Betaproteobacteria bacterium]|nr:DUF4266 domain-containing protein [Betaproteobacteria bacterium]